MSQNVSTTPPVSCTLCPRCCGADRAAGQTGFCGAGGTLKAARAALHFWEEPCISGTRGSGTVFFSGCTLKCCFCQNYPIMLMLVAIMAASISIIIPTETET